MRIGQKMAIPMAIVAAGNAITGIKEGCDIVYYLLYSLPFVIMALIFALKRKDPQKKNVSIMLLGMSCLAIFIGELTDLVPVTLLCISLYLAPQKRRMLILYTIISVISYLIRFAMLNLPAIPFVVFFSGSSLIFLLYHHYIHPRSLTKSIKKVNNPRVVHPDVQNIISLRIQGFDWPEINDILKLNITDDRVRAKVAGERRRLGFENQDAFIYWFTVNGKIANDYSNAHTKEYNNAKV